MAMVDSNLFPYLSVKIVVLSIEQIYFNLTLTHFNRTLTPDYQQSVYICIVIPNQKSEYEKDVEFWIDYGCRTFFHWSAWTVNAQQPIGNHVSKFYGMFQETPVPSIL